LPPPLKDPGHRNKQKLRETLSYDPEIYHENYSHRQNGNNIEVVEEHALRPSELIRGNQNRSMSMISGEFGI